MYYNNTNTLEKCVALSLWNSVQFVCRTPWEFKRMDFYYAVCCEQEKLSLRGKDADQ